MAQRTSKPDDESAGRVRRWAPKTRTGCFTCRKRKVKCDEAKPRCRRCEAIGIVCGGYIGTTIMIHDFSSGKHKPLILKEVGDSPAPIAVKTKPHDMRIFDLLRNETIQQLVGPFDRDFWTVNVLQATRQYPAMWHASLTLAAIQKHRTIPDSALLESESARSECHALYVFSLQQYSHSVKSVLEIVRKPAAQLTHADKEAVLLAAIIFSAISSLKGDVQEAKIHARHCIQLFQCWCSWQAVDSFDSAQDKSRANCVLRPETLAAIVTHFESQFPTTSGGATELVAYHCGTAPYTFAGEAYFEFMQLFCGLNAAARFHETDQVPNASEDDSSVGPAPDMLWHYRSEFYKWQSRFNRLRVTNFRKPVDRQGIRVLELLFKGIKPVLAMDPVTFVRGWDEYHARFWNLYGRASAVLEQEDAQNGSNKNESWNSDTFIFSETSSPSPG